MMSIQRKILLAALIMAALALTAGTILAANNREVNRYVIAGGGRKVQGTNYGVIGTMGQGVASGVGDFGTSANYGACAGFWCTGVPTYKIYLPLVLRNA
jgi:hypothetical protein